MTTRNETRQTVRIGGREVSLLVGALLAREADRLGVLPGTIGDVVIPDPAPTHVELSEFNLSVFTAAMIAEEADARGIQVREMMALILSRSEEVAAAAGLPRRDTFDA